MTKRLLELKCSFIYPRLPSTPHTHEDATITFRTIFFFGTKTYRDFGLLDPLTMLSDTTVLMSCVAESRSKSSLCIPSIPGPNCINHPMVAEGTMSVKGRISSTKLRYFRLGLTSSYIAMMRAVCIGAQPRSNTSPTTGKKVRRATYQIDQQRHCQTTPNTLGQDDAGNADRGRTRTGVVDEFLTGFGRQQSR